MGRALLADYEAGRSAPDAARTRVAELWADLRVDYEVNGRHIENLAKAWKHLEPVFGRDRAVDVTTPRLRGYVRRRLAAGAAPATARLELAVLRRAFTLGLEAGRVTRVPVFPSIKVENVRTGFLEAEGYVRLLAELPPHLRPLAVLGCWLGWRRSELLGLEWRQVSLVTGEVRLDVGTTKNREGRVAYLPPEALEELRAWRAETDRVERERGMIVRWVCHRDGQQIRDHYSAWRSACVRAGLPGLMLHDLRRSAARAYVRSGVPERVVQDVLGQRTRSILDRYNIVSEQDLRDAAARVQQVGGERRAEVVGLR
ncbi:MAG TPA: site-specific integrase [Candidatus Binatia bacterium]|nr:site-specific integrase [Candidatus Binatia bacterium]